MNKKSGSIKYRFIHDISILLCVTIALYMIWLILIDDQIINLINLYLYAPIFLNYVFYFDQIFLLSYILIFLKFIGLWRRVNDYTLYRHLYISGEYKIFMTSFWAFFGAATMNENEELCLNLMQQKGTNKGYTLNIAVKIVGEFSYKLIDQIYCNS